VQTRFACPFRHLPLSGGQIFARYGKASEICFINGMGGIVMWNLLHSSLGIVYGSLELGFLQYGDRKVPTGKVIGFIGHPKSMRVP
jgi:hypothetical protein